MQVNYDYALKQVLVWETGFDKPTAKYTATSLIEECIHLTKTTKKNYTGLVNHPKDPGGKTNFGVIQRTYDSFRKNQGNQKQDVLFISPEEIKKIYAQEFARKIRFDDLPTGLDYALFDFAVNSGVKNAVTELQKFLGVTPDGILGANTLAAIKNKPTDKLVLGLTEARMKFLKRLPHWSDFGKGWTRRVRAVNEGALALIASKDIDTQRPVGGSEKASGGLSVKGSIETSRRSKAALAGGAVGFLGVVPEVMDTVQPIRESLDGLKYAALISFVLMICIFGYIIWIRTKHD